jgi:hypothetical protein
MQEFRMSERGRGWGCPGRDKKIENSIVKGGRRWKRKK